MDTENTSLPNGYSAVPAGKIANVVTCLEMLEKPPAKTVRAPETGLSVERWENPDLGEYRALFRAVGEEWMWLSRLVMPDEKLSAILSEPDVDIYTLKDGRRRVGLLELDFRTLGECELVFCGLVSDAIGQGAGRALMNAAIDRAWERPIKRFWLHTCHFDHPGAIAFYQRSGFRPYASMVEVTDDPRLTGQMRRDAAKHVPLIEPR
ncbi:MULTISPECIES: GNAT family N-acetyltransferase [Alphaproteobacteria]|uniref:N-acetyltransferase n=2 Tax=Alphaproteobacteria TaxID=28211 RepID=A0A512HDB1_9HYPH|nr:MULTISPECIES: GNAT family N-acetyltransferase [Alphaproteobacteria]GEO83436.1 N-acetyltransferase [Ciceribacter naphthalenivorans]GLR22991.1 N-acetyltransferase [Ciceribacter naphthalenivorans]GLT05847.1 N-acetyltransferase [Sphingomonas psychrolutea]